MRRFIAILGLVVLSAVGCHHVGGKCDCGPTPGDAALYAPFHSYSNNAPIIEGIGTPKELPKK
jgi:hypothetical protein